MAEAKKRPLSALERARQQAAEQGEAFARRQKELTQLAVDYLMAGSRLEQTLESVARRMEPLREEARLAGDTAQQDRARVVARMRELEAPEQEVASRLGVSLGEVRRSMALVRSWAAVEPSQAQGEAVAGAGGGGGAAPVEPELELELAPEGGGDGVGVPPLPGVPPPGLVVDGQEAPGLEGWASWPAEPGAGR